MIDAHQHFWTYSAAEYDWIDDRMARIRRDFLPLDLAPRLAEAGVRGTVAVQARQTLEETSWLLELARHHPLIRAVVGWVPLAKPAEAAAELDRLGDRPELRGVRHVVQGEADGFLDRADFNAGLREVTARGLTYDLLVFARQLREAIRFVDRHPAQPFVLDHIAKPRVEGAPDAAWVAAIRELARRPNVACKFSGVVTEVPGWTWTPELLRPYFDVVLGAFGPRRLMFGSDWPVCLVAAEYRGWVDCVRSFAQPLSPDEQEWILERSAQTAYRLQP